MIPLLEPPKETWRVSTAVMGNPVRNRQKKKPRTRRGVRKTKVKRTERETENMRKTWKIKERNKYDERKRGC